MYNPADQNKHLFDDFEKHDIGVKRRWKIYNTMFERHIIDMIQNRKP